MDVADTYTVGDSKFIFTVEDIFKEYYAPLCYFASGYIADRDLVEDLVQDLFASLIEKKQTFESPLHLKNFLYFSLKNACLNTLRHGNSHEKYVNFITKKGESSEFFLHNIITTEILREIADAVAGLPSECRKVFELCYFENLDNEKAAEILAISIFTVKAQKARGKKILREKLRDLYPLFLLLLQS